MLGKVSLHEGLSRGGSVGEGTLGTPIPAGVSPARWTGGPGSCWGSKRVGGRQDSWGSGKGANAHGPRAAHRPPPQGLGLHQGRGLVPAQTCADRRLWELWTAPHRRKAITPTARPFALKAGVLWAKWGRPRWEDEGGAGPEGRGQAGGAGPPLFSCVDQG